MTGYPARGSASTPTRTMDRDGDRNPVEVALRRRLGDVLVSRGVLSAEELEGALAAQRAVQGSRRRLGQVVIDRGLASDRQVAESLAELLGLELVDLGGLTLDPELVRLLPRAVAERTGMLVLSRSGRTLTVAAADPTNVVALDDVKLYTRTADIRVVVAAESQVRAHLKRAWSLSEDASDATSAFEEIEAQPSEEEQLSGGADDAPTVRLVNMIFGDAVRSGASDIHVEPQRELVRIRYRVDGVLREVMTLPRSAGAPLTSRIKIVSGLDIAERRLPQDGRTRISVDGQGIDSRVSTLPSLHGEKVVVRLLARADQVPKLDGAGLEPDQLTGLRRVLHTPQGLVLITGPTGSGKTNTLYASVSEVLSPELNIVTLEDPIEVQLPGITQVQVHQRAGMTFARGLRAILRQDPDVVLVGEVRDAETAELAMEASLTGHLVLTTLHTNSAVAALTRLVDMGIEPFLVASSLSAVVAQRLVRRPCAGCVAPDDPDPAVLGRLELTGADLAGATPMRGRGCADCGHSGYRGRTGVFELLLVDSTLRVVLTKTPNEGALAAAARAAGMTTLRASAVALARRGGTTFEEALRVTHADEGAH